MKPKKKTVYKEIDLASALIEAVTKKPSAAQAARQKKLREAITANRVGYDADYDSYYDSSTGEWLEKKCSDKSCLYCKHRPAKKSL